MIKSNQNLVKMAKEQRCKDLMENGTKSERKRAFFDFFFNQNRFIFKFIMISICIGMFVSGLVYGDVSLIQFVNAFLLGLLVRLTFNTEIKLYKDACAFAKGKEE